LRHLSKSIRYEKEADSFTLAELKNIRIELRHSCKRVT
jgi:hypothetical protein